jgi:hypothetical protein
VDGFQTILTGGLIEPHAFGCEAPSNVLVDNQSQSAGLLDVNSPSYRFALEDAIGISSLALASLFSTDSVARNQVSLTIPFWDIVNRSPMFPISTPSGTTEVCGVWVFSCFLVCFFVF